VFSWRELDHGTRLLLDSLQVRVTDRVLDAACGTGLAGLLAQRGASKGRVTWLDPELLAVESTRATLAANGASGTVLQGDAVDAAAGEGPFTLILGSPGQRGGWAVNDEVAEALAEEAYAALEPRGRFVLVTNRFVSYQRAIEARFGAVVTLAENKGYRVLSAEKAFVRKVRGRPTRRQRQAADEETVYQID
jgi:16S rRNA (guanine1207-N2)-methyltransferase